MSKGLLQFDLWGVTPDSGLWDWSKLRADIKRYGVRNSLLTAPMPTASTSQILQNNECFEPFTSNVYLRQTLAGEFVVVCRPLVEDLEALGLWNKEMKDRIIAADGSVQGIPEIPEKIRALYKTAFELPQKVLIDMAADRGPYVDQSQSLNFYLPTLPETGGVDRKRLHTMHFYAWRRGLKTGMYYLHIKASSAPAKMTVSPELERKAKEKQVLQREEQEQEQERSKKKGSTEAVEEEPPQTCSREKPGCVTCSG